MTVIFTRQARKDLAEARAYLAKHSPAAVARLAEAIRSAVERLASGLVEGPEVEFRDGRKVRSWSVPPYRIYYRKSRGALVVARIYHSARRPLERD